MIDPNGFQPLPLADQAGEATPLLAEAEEKARQIVATAEADAQHLREEARSLRTRTLADATRDANGIRDTARAEQEQRQKRDDKLDTWAARAIIAGTVGLTASGEYALARMVGFDQSVAWLLPFVIDVYVIQAFRRHRDIVQAISLTVAANVTYHLADRGLFGVEAVKDRQEPQWWLIAMVASVASLILWRVHLMTAPPKAKRDRQKKKPRPRHVICAGVDGALTLRRPSPAAPAEPSGPIGAPVSDVDAVLSGVHAPVVYFVRNGNRVKIGTSTNLRRRVKQLCLRLDDIVLVLHGDAALEAELHRRFDTYRIDNTEWFQRNGTVARFIVTQGRDSGDKSLVAEPTTGASEPTGQSASSPANNRQQAPTAGASNTANTPTAPRPRAGRTGGRKSTGTRRSLDEWVSLATPIFHEEFVRLRRNPTGNEFANAITKAGLGKISDSTAKNIRTEILDRAPLPKI